MIEAGVSESVLFGSGSEDLWFNHIAATYDLSAFLLDCPWHW